MKEKINTLIIDCENLDIEPTEYPALPNCAVVHFHYSPENPDHPLTFIKIEDLLQETAKH